MLEERNREKAEDRAARERKTADCPGECCLFLMLDSRTLVKLFFQARGFGLLSDRVCRNSRFSD